MMKLKRTSTAKNLKSNEKSKETRGISNSPKSKKSNKHNQTTLKNMQSGQLNSVFHKKQKQSKLIKKRIQQLRSSQIMIKVNYKGKKISIPITEIDDRSLHQLVIPYIIRFEHEVLSNQFNYHLDNAHFHERTIESWKTINKVDPLKDFYFQTNKSLGVFRGQLLQIEPIWKQKIQKVQLADFQIIKCIGTGGFSRVFLARLRLNGKFYALKLVEKEGLFESGKDCVVSNERDIMVGLNCSFLVNLEFAFETKHFVALVLEYCPGGELFYYLRKVKRMNEDDARFCFMQILLGLQYLHNQHVIYRDIKPQNIMIDLNGNLKIADFGLSKPNIQQYQLAYTYCGSPQYMAPQMLLKNGHSFALDYYCLGALLYELVTGNPPFYSRDVDKIYHSIQNQEIDFPSYVDLSPEIKMLLESLLNKDPNRRLGSLSGIREILAHPWVRKLNPNDVQNKTVKTPISIDLLTFNVNEDEIEEMQTDFITKLHDKNQEFKPMFEDFYFNRYSNTNIIEQGFPSVKSQSTKENKSLTAKFNRQKQVKNTLSVMSNERGTRLNLSIRNKLNVNRKSSEVRRKSKPSKGYIQPTNHLVQRSKQNLKKCTNKRMVSPNQCLKKIKSTNALINVSYNRPI